MSKSLDQLAKNLASGMSRRKALWSFITSFGAVAALTGRKAYAGTQNQCAAFCDAQAGMFYELCIQTSLECGTGSCAEFSFIGINGSEPIGVDGAATLAINSTTLSYHCVPVTRRFS